MEQILDHAAQAQARLAQQYREKPRFLGVVGAIGQQAQGVEDALYPVLSEFIIDNADGTQLDILGAIVGQSRQSFADADYREYLKARIALNRSAGTGEDIYALFTPILPAGVTQEVLEHFPAALTLRLGSDAVSASLAELFVLFLRAGKAAGVRAVLEWSELAAGSTFSFFDSPTGLGFGDSTTPATGGGLSGAA